MGVVDRLEDARVLYASGRRMGSLLSVLIAVAATSRKRYPRNEARDSEAFTRFLRDEASNMPLSPNLELQFRGSLISFPDLLYEFVRCELTHEAELPEDVVFEPKPYVEIKVEPGRITFTDALIDRLASVVEQAPENALDATGGDKTTKVSERSNSRSHMGTAAVRRAFFRRPAGL